MCFFSGFSKRREQKEFIAGYDWAAGVLLRKDLSYEEVNLSTFGDHSHAFDRGAIAALAAITRLKQSREVAKK